MLRQTKSQIKTIVSRVILDCAARTARINQSMPDSYSVYVSHRPVCAAFLINTSTFEKRPVELWNVLDAIADYNLETWGGRSNPLILFEGDDLPAGGWELLERTDPDLIKGFSSFSPNLLSKLDERVYPIAIHESRSDDDFQNRNSIVHLDLMGVPVTPSRSTLDPLGSHHFLMFEFSDSCPAYVRRFVEANFGAYWQWRDARTNSVKRIAYLEHSLKSVSPFRLEISSARSLSDALITIAGTPLEPQLRKFIYPWRLQSLLRRQPWKAYQLRHSFPVVIGSDPTDYQLFWNAAIWNDSWVDPGGNGLWIPWELATDREFHPGLCNWLRHLSGQTAEGVRFVELYSGSQSQAELEKLAVDLRGNQTLFCRVGANDPNWGRQDWLEKRETSTRLISPPRLGRDVHRFTARSESEVVSLSIPEIIQLQNAVGGWMADIQIEFWPGKYRRGNSLWWRFPKRRSAEIVQAMLSGPARITDLGLPSRFLQANGKSGSDSIPPELDLRLIPEQQIPPWLISTSGPSRWL
jgi:hypothetical protein